MSKEDDKSINIDELIKRATKGDQESLKKLKILTEETEKKIKAIEEKLKEQRQENEHYQKEIELKKNEIELKKKEIENEKFLSKIKDEIIKEKDNEIEQIKKRMKLMKINNFDIDILSQDFIDKFKSTFTTEQQKEISELQELLIGNNESNKKFENYTMKRAFDYKFGNSIDNNKFISYINEGISILYSNNDNQDAFAFFKNIKKYIKDFLYIPMLKNNTLYELKKFIYLKVITNQLKFDDGDLLLNHILYNESNFNESPFEEIQTNIISDKILLKYFPQYGESTQIKLNLETIRDYIFSKTIQEAYFETCKEIFGEDAKFVTVENIKKASNDIYENIIKTNLRYAKLEDGFFGFSLYSKKILIKNSFITNIKNAWNERKKITLLVALIMTILREVSHCLINLLPIYDIKYEELSNPFIPTFKKNITIFDYVKGETMCEGGNVLDILKEKIKNYNLITDSGCHFEKKIFNNCDHYNYLISEYFLRINNLNCSLKEFIDNFENFKKTFGSDDANSLNKGVTILNRGCFLVIGTCFLNPNGIFVME